MNNYYCISGIKNVFVLGDCHGEFRPFFGRIKSHLTVKSEDEDKPHPKEVERQTRMAATMQTMLRGRANINVGVFGNPIGNPIKTQSKLLAEGLYANSLFIIAGDCGIGFNKQKYYMDLFERFNKILSYNNTHIMFVRGNHDDPSYFDGKTINLSNIKAVPDYSVINAKDTNILCIGGAISIDRKWRIKQEERINRFSTTKKKTIYWENERPIFNEPLLNEITNSIKIDCVVSHTAPSFVNPETHSGVDEWSKDDETLISDIQDERKVMDRVFETLRDKGTKPKYWAYGHFNLNYIEKRSDTIFRGLSDGFDPISIHMEIVQFEVIEAEKKKKAKNKSKLKVKSLTERLAELDHPIIEQAQPEQFEEEPMMADEEGQPVDGQADEGQNDGVGHFDNDDMAQWLQTGVVEGNEEPRPIGEDRLLNFAVNNDTLQRLRLEIDRTNRLYGVDNTFTAVNPFNYNLTGTANTAAVNIRANTHVEA